MRRPVLQLSLTKSMLHASLTVVANCSGTRSLTGRLPFLRLRTARSAARCRGGQTCAPARLLCEPAFISAEAPRSHLAARARTASGPHQEMLPGTTFVLCFSRWLWRQMLAFHPNAPIPQEEGTDSPTGKQHVAQFATLATCPHGRSITKAQWHRL